WFVGHELVHRRPCAWPCVVVMHDDDAVVCHPWIEEPQACQDRFVKVRVEMNEGECPILNLLWKAVRKVALDEMNTFVKRGDHSLHMLKGCVGKAVSSHNVPGCSEFFPDAPIGKPLERIKKE